MARQAPAIPGVRSCMRCKASKVRSTTGLQPHLTAAPAGGWWLRVLQAGGTRCGSRSASTAIYTRCAIVHACAATPHRHASSLRFGVDGEVYDRRLLAGLDSHARGMMTRSKAAANKCSRQADRHDCRVLATHLVAALAGACWLLRALQAGGTRGGSETATETASCHAG